MLKQSQQLMHVNPLEDDLGHIFSLTEGLWEELRGKRIFITGGTGFFGCWFLESFIWANEHLGLNASITVLTRDGEAFKKKMPYLATNPAVYFHIGDVRNFDFPDGKFEYIIHAAATSATAKFNNEDPSIIFNTAVTGARRVLDFAIICRAKKLLLISSGAMYGKQQSDVPYIPEDYIGMIDSNSSNTPNSESKKASEFLSAQYSEKYGFEIKIARCFSFVGPYLPLDIHYAIGNFIRDGIKGGPIIVNGDGTPYRSYLYASDLMIWLWTILFKGESGRPYNVGSEEDVTIFELAHMVAHSSQCDGDVIIMKEPSPGDLPERYVPSTSRARTELGLRQTITLRESIKRTIIFLKMCRAKKP